MSNEGVECICKKSISVVIAARVASVGKKVWSLFSYPPPREKSITTDSRDTSSLKTPIAESSPQLENLVWPETIITKITPERYQALVNTDILMSGVDALDVLTKLKVVLYGLQADHVISPDHAKVGDAMLCEFIHTIKQHHEPNHLLKIDVLIGKVLGYTIKSCMTPEAIQKIDREAWESLH